MQGGLNFRLLLLDLRFLTFQTFKLTEEKVQHDCINNPGVLVHLIFSLTVSALIFLSSFQFCNADSCAAFFKLWPGLNSLICARLVFVYGMSETIVFRGHHKQMDRYCHVPTPCQFSERQRIRSLCVIRREIDFCVHLVCPSLLCFRAQFREAYDVLTHVL